MANDNWELAKDADREAWRERLISETRQKMMARGHGFAAHLLDDASDLTDEQLEQFATGWGVSA